jgi:periplasmic divalent cation tolerance protein
VTEHRGKGQPAAVRTEPSEAIVVLMTAANAAEAARLAEMLVGAQLAACVQILPPMDSIYRWKGTIERETEVLLIAKTARSKFEEVEREVRALHSYETPEIIALPITAGSAPYLMWLSASLDPQSS